MKDRLIILSDLWGCKKSQWVKNYTDKLTCDFDIQYYDCCGLAEVDTVNYTEENLHNQFVKGGIEIAVQNLLKSEKSEVYALGFSVGGVIAWKAALKGLKIKNLVAVSSTRLRYEKSKPNCNIDLYFGEKDTHIPSLKWFKELQIENKIIKNKSHVVYLESDFANTICTSIKDV